MADIDITDNKNSDSKPTDNQGSANPCKDKAKADGYPYMKAVTCKDGTCHSVVLSVGKHHIDADGHSADTGILTIETIPADDHAVYCLMVTDGSKTVMHNHRPLKKGAAVFLDYSDTLIIGDTTIMLQ